jgi:hypothetical protein
MCIVSLRQQDWKGRFIPECLVFECVLCIFAFWVLLSQGNCVCKYRMYRIGLKSHSDWSENSIPGLKARVCAVHAIKCEFRHLRNKVCKWLLHPAAICTLALCAHLTSTRQRVVGLCADGQAIEYHVCQIVLLLLVAVARILYLNLY